MARLISDGLINREAAEQLGLSEHTIKNHLFNIFNKLGISTRSELVMYGLSHKDNNLKRVDEPA